MVRSKEAIDDAKFGVCRGAILHGFRDAVVTSTRPESDGRLRLSVVVTPWPGDAEPRTTKDGEQP